MPIFLKKPLKYMASTGITFYLEFGLLWLFTDFFHVNYLKSAVLASIICITIGYFINRFFVFTDSKRSYVKAYIMYFFICLVSLGIVTVGMYILVHIAHVYYLLSRIILTIFTFAWTYSMNAFVNFKDEK